MDAPKNIYFLNVDAWRAYIKASVCEKLPPRLQWEVKPLVTLLEGVPEVDWDQKHQLVLGGETVVNSNIIELIRALISDKQYSKYPKGWFRLVGVLQNNNLTREFMDSSLRRKKERKLGQSRVRSLPGLRRLRSRAPKVLATVGPNDELTFKVTLQVVAAKGAEAVVSRTLNDSFAVYMKRLMNMFFNSSIFEIMIGIFLIICILLLIL